MADNITESKLKFGINPSIEAINPLTPKPFYVVFAYGSKRVQVTLTNGEDVLKLGETFAKFLAFNGIENKIETYED